MEFDKNKVYTALNADELKVGSKCIFADTVKRLSELVESDDMQEHMHVLIAVLNDDKAERFEIEHTTYSLAYLIEPPKEPQYRPFSTLEKAKEAIDKHGGWVKKKTTGDLKLITSINGAYKIYSIGTGGTHCNLHAFLECYVFADDGTPCGELVDE